MKVGLSIKIRNLIRILSRLCWLPMRPSYEIIIVDNASDLIKDAIGDTHSCFELPIRGECWYINFTVLLKCIRLIFIRRKIQIGLRGCYVTSIAQTLKSNIIITFIDNNNWSMGVSEYSDIRMITIQNGSRLKKDLWAKSYDIYLAIHKRPKFEQALIDSHTKHFEVIGSLRYGQYIKENQIPPNWPANKKRISFVSQYRSKKKAASIDGPIHAEIAKYTTNLIPEICNFSRANKFELQILLAAKNTEDIAEEVAFYRAIIGETTCEFIDSSNDKWTNYQAAMNSYLVIGLYSTLLFEILGAGVPVLFCYFGMSKKSVERINSGHCLDAIAPFCIEKADQILINQTFEFLIEGNRQELFKKLEAAKEYCNPINYNQLPHTKLLKVIDDLGNKNEGHNEL